jgi:CubicO group peptidase (beta-lactamase class C family)
VRPLIVAAFVAVPATLASQGPVVVAPVARAADSILVAAASRGFAGVALVIKDGAPILRKGYGVAQRETSAPFEPGTVVQIGSNTKDFTMVAILQLMSRDRLAPTDHISRFFPDAPADKQAITIRHLLDHRSGLPMGIGPDPELVTREEFKRRVFAAPLIAAPGEREQYSNAGFSLLALIIEHLSGQTYDQYVRDNILVPAGLARTGYLLPDFDRKRVAHGSAGANDKGTILDFAHPADGPSWTLRGNGGMLSTVDEMATFYRTLYATERLLPAEFRNRRFDPNEATILSGSDMTSFFVYQREPAARLEMFLVSVTAAERAPQLMRQVAAVFGVGRGGGEVRVTTEINAPPITLPETPAGRTIREYLEMFNKADSAAAERFFRERVAPPAGAPPPAARAARTVEIHGDLGRLTPIGYDVQPDGRIEVRMRGAGPDVAVFIFEIEPAAPYRMRSLGIRVGG